jgi:hypothetical protein
MLLLVVAAASPDSYRIDYFLHHLEEKEEGRGARTAVM